MIKKRQHYRYSLVNSRRRIDFKEIFNDILSKLNSSEVFHEEDFIFLIDQLKIPTNCVHFVNTDNSFFSLIKYVAGVDGTLRLLAIKTVNQLLLSNVLCSYDIVKTICPILMCFLSGLNYKTTVASLQTLGSCSSVSISTWEILYSQNLLRIVLNLLNSSNNDVVQSVLICLLQFIQTGLYRLQLEELNEIFRKCVSIFNKFDLVHWIFYQLSCVKNFLTDYSISKELSIKVMMYVERSETLSLITGTAFVRISANIVSCDESGIISLSIMNNITLFFSKCRHLYSYSHFVCESKWLLSNLLNHPNKSVSQAVANDNIFITFASSFC